MTMLASIQIGRPRTLGDPSSDDPFTREWTTAIFKEPVEGPVTVERDGIIGDGQADRTAHGGPDKAICVYSADHYPFWRDDLARPELPFGAFGENFTVAGVQEPDLCIGDVLRIGQIVVEVSQPRTPCWKLARKWGTRTLPARVVETGHSGWYLRVRETGEVEAGADFVLEDRPHADWTLSRANRVMHYRDGGAAAAAELAAIPALAESWRATLQRGGD